MNINTCQWITFVLFVVVFHPVQRYFKFGLLLVFLFPHVLSAQRPLVLQIKDNSNGDLLYNGLKTDSTDVALTVQRFLRPLIGKGFLTASAYMLMQRADTVVYSINKGNTYNWVALHRGNLDEDVLSYSGYREKLFDDKPLKPDELSKLFERVLRYCENHGFPFATIQLDSIQLSANGVEATIRLSKNQAFVIDSVEIYGTSAIKRSYLYNFSGIKPGSVYNESLIRSLDTRINQLPFARTTKPLKVYYTGNKARIVTFIDQKKASQVDGVLGLAPQSAVNNKLVLTGELNLNLQNLLGTGKVFELHYRSFLAGSQELKARATYPYLLNSALGVDYAFGLLRFDSLYLQVDHDIGLHYMLGGSDYVRFFYQAQNYSLLTVDTLRIRLTRSLPQFADMRNNIYGLGMHINRLDYLANPRKGYYFDVQAGAGIKNILRNTTINSITLTDASLQPYNLYDSLTLRSLQYRFLMNVQKFWPLGKQSTLLTQLMAASLQAEQIFTNELFRIGGIRTLKGFDEQSIFCNSYGILNLEYRYLLNSNSNFILLFNGAWYERNDRTRVLTDWPWGIGTGLNLQTGAGIFSFYYALGREQNNPIQWRQGKIHFGIVNYF